ncbi:MAG TPA: acyclic terpene utilization AtuA family protein, partial [Urbifossiella sp.]
MKRVRIGNGCGFWGDNLDAPIRLAADGRLDYLTLEYLAELTMSILAVQKGKNPEAGFATDFLDVLGRLTPILKQQPGLKIITNAGGMNPHGCAAKARDILAKAGLADRKIGIVSGDDLMPRLDDLIGSQPSPRWEEGGRRRGEGSPNGERVIGGLNHLDTGEPLSTLRNRVVSANAYLGAGPIVEALRGGASIIITGRVADASLTVGPAAFEFGWNFNDLDRLASATVAGHLIECGAQATGGL